MKRIVWPISALLMLFIGTTVGWVVANYQRDREQAVANRIALRLMDEQSLKSRQFFGPVAIERAGTQRVFSWRSIEGSPSLQLDVSPLGDVACLYEVQNPGNLRKLQCEELR